MSEVWLSQLEAHMNHIEYVISGRKYEDDVFDCYEDSGTSFVSAEAGEDNEGPISICKYSHTYISEQASYLERCITVARQDMALLLVHKEDIDDGRVLFRPDETLRDRHDALVSSMLLG